MHSNHLTGGYLLLEDGARFPGQTMHSDSFCLGEAVFNTSHTGYQEILTDPSYFRQILIFTAPHIGNVGVNSEDVESAKIQAAGVVIRSPAPQPRNWRSEGDLQSWLRKSGIPLLTGIDTRAVTLHLRERGAMRAGIFSDRIKVDDALEKVRASPSMVGADLASEVSCKTSYNFSLTDFPSDWHPQRESGSGLHVAVIDFGVKRNILRELVSRGCEATVLPADTPASEIIKGDYHGFLLSNGPGDPAAVSSGIETVRRLLTAEIPIFGICLGHQLVALAAGFKTFKLPFGHRGSNHPVRREEDGVVEITSQNHGFAVRSDGLGEDWLLTHINLNDGTVEGLAHKSQSIFSIQYHPEASPGPHEALPYFDRFIREMRHAKV